jgi:hypothetical protein
MIEPDDEAAGRDPYYTRSSATSGDIPRLVVKCDDAFVVSDDHEGQRAEAGREDQGDLRGTGRQEGRHVLEITEGPQSGGTK